MNGKSVTFLFSSALNDYSKNFEVILKQVCGFIRGFWELRPLDDVNGGRPASTLTGRHQGGWGFFVK